MAQITNGYAPNTTYWHQSLLRRLVVTLGIGTVVGLMLTLMTRQALWTTLVYSWCISLGCSFTIDLLRRAALAWVRRDGQPPSAPAAAGWPGWGWMSAILVAGTIIGFTAGAKLADRLTGLHETTLLSGSLAAAATLLVVSLIPGFAATYYYRAKGRLQAVQAQAEAAQRQAAETRLKLLESQLEPHMLFNTLANLRALIAVDPDRATDMLDRLIAYLRGTLQASRSTSHSLSTEVERLSDYLALMKVRMGARLTVDIAMPPELAHIPVPTLLLQPLVENAIQHGLEPQRGAGTIHVTAAQEGREIVLRVVDNGVGTQAAASRAVSARPGTGGFGLTQVRERLATAYGDAASLDLRPGADGVGTVATIRLPGTTLPGGMHVPG